MAQLAHPAGFASATADSDRLDPETIVAHRYRVLEDRGDDSFGQNYIAEDSATGARVTLLRLAREFSQAQVRERLFEGFARGRLGHRHIVDAIDCGEDLDGRLFVVSPGLPDAVRLDQLLAERGPLPWPRALAIAGEIAEALAHAHAAGAVHGGLDPRRVFVAEGGKGSVHVVDFGLAHALAEVRGHARREVTQSGPLPAAPSYLAPEQVRGQGIDARCDLYALGMLLWELVDGRPPFTGEAGEVLEAQLHASLPALECPGAPAELEAFLQLALAKPKAERFSSAAEMLRTLRALPKVGGAAARADAPRPAGDTRNPATIGRPRTSLVQPTQPIAKDEGTKGAAARGATATSPGRAPIVHSKLTRPGSPAPKLGQQLGQQLGKQPDTPADKQPSAPRSTVRGRAVAPRAPAARPTPAASRPTSGPGLTPGAQPFAPARPSAGSAARVDPAAPADRAAQADQAAQADSIESPATTSPAARRLATAAALASPSSKLSHPSPREDGGTGPRAAPRGEDVPSSRLRTPSSGAPPGTPEPTARQSSDIVTGEIQVEEPAPPAALPVPPPVALHPPPSSPPPMAAASTPLTPPPPVALPERPSPPPPVAGPPLEHDRGTDKRRRFGRLEIAVALFLLVDALLLAGWLLFRDRGSEREELADAERPTVATVDADERRPGGAGATSQERSADEATSEITGETSADPNSELEQQRAAASVREAIAAELPPEPTVPGPARPREPKLSARDFREAMIAARTDIVTACLDNQMRRTLKVALKVGASGKVQYARVLGELGDTQLGRCVAEQSYRVEFPATDTGGTHTYTLRLR